MDIKELGYVLVGAPGPEPWRQFSTDVLGAMAIDDPDGALYIKVDHRQFRFAILPHENNAFLAAGWAVADDRAFVEALTYLESAGVAFSRGDAAGRALRHVADYIRFNDPSGAAHEIFWGPSSDGRRFVSPVGVSRFVTGELGLGHVVLAAPENFDLTVTFWRKTMGFGLSDILRLPLPGDATLQAHFMHCGNGRQHSLALADFAFPGGCIHAMLEVENIDEVGRALDRVYAHDVPITMTLGRHINDGMISFYIMTPGGFMIEYGAGGEVVDWDRHVAFESTNGSHWGHSMKPPGNGQG